MSRTPLSAGEAVEELFQLHADEVYRYAVCVLGNRAEAEDVVQEVFIRVLRSWERFRNESAAKTWLWTIARNCVHDVYRRQSRRKEYLMGAERLPEPASPVQTPAETAELELQETLAGLSEPYRQVVTLRLIEDLSTEDTAKVLGWSTAKVRTTLHRAVNALRKVLGPDGVLLDPQTGREQRPYGI